MTSIHYDFHYDFLLSQLQSAKIENESMYHIQHNKQSCEWCVIFNVGISIYNKLTFCYLKGPMDIWDNIRGCVSLMGTKCTTKFININEI